jgi:hypothetical protein
VRHAQSIDHSRLMGLVHPPAILAKVTSMDSFEYSGEWWDLRDPAERWTGMLRFDPVEGAILTVTDPTQEAPADQSLAAAFGRTLREYDVHDASAIVRQQDQHEQEPVGRRRDHEEIRGHDLADVIPQKRAPRLRRRLTPAL